jgi:hypothetical protein
LFSNRISTMCANAGTKGTGGCVGTAVAVAGATVVVLVGSVVCVAGALDGATVDTAAGIT